MKDVLKFSGATLLVLVTLTLVGMVFIQSFMGDYEWLNITLTVVYSLAVIAATLYDGLQRGTQDCKFESLMKKQEKERGYVISPEERARMYQPAKGFIAGLLAASPALLLAIATLFFGSETPLGLTLSVRVALGAFLGIFQYTKDLLPWLYVVVALIYPLCVGLGYLGGPWMWKKQVEMMEKAKKEKRRRVNRRRKVKKTV